VARSRPMFGSRRRRSPHLRLFGVAVLLVGVPVLVALAPSGSETDVADTVARAVPPIEDASPADTDVVTAASHPEPETATFATIDRVTLHLPALEVVLVGFHEASSRESLAFQPVGALEDHQNTTKFDPPADDPDGPPYVVLSSRGRPFPATSAIDVLVAEGEPIRSPVTGIVTDVRGYLLYGKHADQRIEIAPADAPDQRIVMIHLDDVSVSVGDEVSAGSSVVAAGARPFPFGSHIDRYTDPARYPHVHYEVKRAAAGDGET
jgi:murein DD-endopeptidase MepM/ murein hydrolase activator NlpD